MRRIGLFGGSFDPIHNGPLHLIETARHCLSLDEVILIPAYVSPFKQARHDMASSEDRLAMCQLAVQSLPFCHVDSFELERTEVSYTIYTVQQFQEIYLDAEIVLLVGSDMFLSFPKWYRWKEILQIVSLGVISRETDDLEKLEDQKIKLQKYGKIEVCQTSPFPISSTKIREKCKKHQDYACYLPEKVVQYIRMHRLYQMSEQKGEQS